MSGAAFSPISDPEPLVAPKPQKKPKRQKTDYEKIHSDKNYPQIWERLEARKEFYRRYLPDGTEVEKLPDEKAPQAWKNAVTLIKEIEDLQAIIEGHNPKTRKLA